MTALLIGLSTIAIGLAYMGLGLLSAWETISLHNYRGWSRFGIGFSMMAASCGPHHLVHGLHLLRGDYVSWPMFAVTLIGLPAGLVFILLRTETMWGGQGDRLIATSLRSSVLLAGAFSIAAGWLGASAFAQLGAVDPLQVICTSAGLVTRDTTAGFGREMAALTFLANTFVTVTYGMVGWYLADHQVRCQLTRGAWSLSGVALTGVFFTCALMHLIDATTAGDGSMLVFDLIGVPASVYFLWVVKQVHNDFVSDWNRRPLVGVAAAPARPSPWSEKST